MQRRHSERPLRRAAGRVRSLLRGSSGRRKPRAPYANLIAFIRSELQRKPDDLRLRQSLVTHLGRAGRYREAIEEAERLLKLAPGLVEARRLLFGFKLHRLFRGSSV